MNILKLVAYYFALVTFRTYRKKLWVAVRKWWDTRKVEKFLQMPFPGTDPHPMRGWTTDMYAGVAFRKLSYRQQTLVFREFLYRIRNTDDWLHALLQMDKLNYCTLEMREQLILRSMRLFPIAHQYFRSLETLFREDIPQLIIDAYCINEERTVEVRQIGYPVSREILEIWIQCAAVRGNFEKLKILQGPILSVGILQLCMQNAEVRGQIPNALACAHELCDYRSIAKYLSLIGSPDQMLTARLYLTNMVHENHVD